MRCVVHSHVQVVFVVLFLMLHLAVDLHSESVVVLSRVAFVLSNALFLALTCLCQRRVRRARASEGGGGGEAVASLNLTKSVVVKFVVIGFLHMTLGLVKSMLISSVFTAVGLAESDTFCHYVLDEQQRRCGDDDSSKKKKSL